MGGLRRIKKRMSQPIAMADTKMTVNGCKVYLGHPNPEIAKKAGAKFTEFMQQTIERARLVNIRDLYTAHFQVLNKIESGEDLVKLDKKTKN